MAVSRSRPPQRGLCRGRGKALVYGATVDDGPDRNLALLLPGDDGQWDEPRSRGALESTAL